MLTCTENHSQAFIVTYIFGKYIITLFCTLIHSNLSEMKSHEKEYSYDFHHVICLPEMKHPN